MVAISRPYRQEDMPWWDSGHQKLQLNIPLQWSSLQWSLLEQELVLCYLKVVSIRVMKSTKLPVTRLEESLLLEGSHSLVSLIWPSQTKRKYRQNLELLLRFGNEVGNRSCPGVHVTNKCYHVHGSRWR